MKKKSTAISSPKVIPPKRNLHHPNNLAQTEIHGIGGLLSSLREVIKTAQEQYFFLNWNALRTELSWTPYRSFR